MQSSHVTIVMYSKYPKRDFYKHIYFGCRTWQQQDTKNKNDTAGGGKKDDCPHTLIAFTVFRAKKYNLRQYI